MPRSFVPPVWCTCGPDGEHLSPVGCARADTGGAGAVTAPLVSLPRAPQLASAHRTSRTDRAQRSYGVVTPLGRSTLFRQPY